MTFRFLLFNSHIWLSQVHQTNYHRLETLCSEMSLHWQQFNLATVTFNYYYKCIDLSDTVTQALQGHCTHNK